MDGMNRLGCGIGNTTDQAYAFREITRLRATVDRLLEIRTYVAHRLRYDQLPPHIVRVMDDTRDAAEAAKEKL